MTRADLERMLPQASPEVLDHLEGKTDAEIAEILDLAAWIQSLPEEARRAAAALATFHRRHPLKAQALGARLARGHVTTDQVLAEALRTA